MPKFNIEMADGRKFVVEADTQPTEAEILAHMGGGATEPRASSGTPTADAFNRAVGLNAREPENYAQGMGRSLEDTGLRTVRGIVKGGAATLNPLNWVTGPYALAKDVLTNGGADTIAGLKTIASGDPEAGGEAIGGLLTGTALGHALPPVVKATKIPQTMVTAGRGLERAGEFTKGVSPYGLAEAAIRGDWKGGAVAAAPYAMKGAGALLRSGGRALGADDLAPTLSRLSTAHAPSLEESLLQALEEAKGSDTLNDLPSRVGNTKPTANIAQKNAMRVDPMSRGGMQATLPDKWGVTTLLPKAQEALLRELMATDSFRKLPR